MFSSRPPNAPPQINRMFLVSICKVLVRVLASALRWYARDRALQYLQQRLLDALAGDVAGYGGVIALARDLVNLVDVDDPRLRLLYVEVGGLGQRRGVGDREGDVEDLGEGLGQERLARTRRAQEQDVRLLELGAVGSLGAHRDALVVVVDGDGQDPLGLVLAYDVLVEDTVDLAWLGEVVVL